ncbi:MAG: hypothetical protein ACLUD0_17645 [Eubacterium ramulus]
MIYALDKVAPGTANDDTLLYGVEVKFYNMEVEIDDNLESCHKGLYAIGDGSGVTSLSVPRICKRHLRSKTYCRSELIGYNIKNPMNCKITVCGIFLK